jgi:TolB-like protein/Tfp pilus assembly protein PilF
MLRLSFADIEIQPDERRVLVAGQPATLGARAFDLLMCLVEHRDRVVSKDELLQRVWPGMVVEESNLTVHVSALRKVLGPQAIATVSGHGYRFVAPLTAEQPATPSTTTRAVEPTAPAEALAARPLLMPAHDKPSLAVMPFANLSGDAAQDYFVDGVVEDITTALSRVRSFFVIARSSSFTYKGRVFDVPQAGRELGVRYLVEGSVRQAGEQLRILVQLVETTAGRIVWSRRFDGLREQIFELEDKIAEQVVAAIEPRVNVAELNRSRLKPTHSLPAYELCLRARPLVLRSASAADAEQADGLLQQAIALDPGYSHAKAMFAYSHLMAMTNWLMSREQAQAGLAYAVEALADHRDDAWTLAMAGHVLAWIGNQHDQGSMALDRALAINPSSVFALTIAGFVRTYAGEFDQAIAHFERTMQLDPLDPEASFVLSGLSLAYLQAGRLDDALAAVRRSRHENPHFMPSRWSLLYILAAIGEWDEARTVAEALKLYRPGYTQAIWLQSTVSTGPKLISHALNTLQSLGVPP